MQINNGEYSALVLSGSAAYELAPFAWSGYCARARRRDLDLEAGESKYGVPNIVYDIIQSVGNLLQGQEKLLEYAEDAERTGDSESATVFRTVAESNRVAAQALLKRLKAHLNKI